MKQFHARCSALAFEFGAQVEQLGVGARRKPEPRPLASRSPLRKLPEVIQVEVPIAGMSRSTRTERTDYEPPRGRRR